MKKKLIFIVALAVPILSYSVGEMLVVKLKNGTESELLLSNVQKITFDASSMTVVSKTGSTTPFMLSGMQKILFSQKTGVTDLANDTGNSLSIYPNPVQDVLFVDGVEENSVIRIFNTKGALFQTTTAKEKVVQLNVSVLPQGMYILQAGNQAIKFIKK